ncbi:MAG: hypothetical protein AUG49_22945 [Catenulispora sp. 13_1_20CM_3_70_7]|nr:MAG: hypothetical protein AUG49_22945 [Catenulispora sp. 13_1_20CM_3_70_7]
MAFPYRTALVTGASSGLGREFARLLAAQGSDLVLVARREDRLAELAAELTAAHAVRVEVLAADLGEDKDVLRVAERLADPSRPVELLVSNAGYDQSGFFHEHAPDVAPAELAVNLVAPVRLCRAALPGMIAAGHGGIVMVSSAVASMPLPKSAVYGASKAFLTSFAESLFMEAAGTGVHVTSIAAGLIRSEFHARAGIDTAGMPKAAWMEPEPVAAAGLKAVAAGKAAVIPGAFNKIQWPFYKIMPRRMLRAMVKRFYRE